MVNIIFSIFFVSARPVVKFLVQFVHIFPERPQTIICGGGSKILNPKHRGRNLPGQRGFILRLLVRPCNQQTNLTVVISRIIVKITDRIPAGR